MFILRSAHESDLQDLFSLSKMMNFINLPSQEEVILEMIKKSQKSFERPDPHNLSKNYYLFILEDLIQKKIIGASMIHAQHGTEEEPHFFLTVGQEVKFSTTINTGFVHGTLKLGMDTNGPTEIGGLILDPQYRGHAQKLGKQLSFVRFLFIGMHPDLFKPVIHSELMPPFDNHGNSPLWEAIGRRFMNMNYQEADKLSRSNKEFILSLFPAENIYQTLLPIEARESIGKVGKETEPVKKMLESIGFEYTFEVDPFDGGPHFRCPAQEVSLIKNKLSGHLSDTFAPLSDIPTEYLSHDVILSVKHPRHQFFAFATTLYDKPSNIGQTSKHDYFLSEDIMTFLKDEKINLPQPITAIPL